MNYTFNFEVVNVISAKLPNIMFAEGKDSMEQVGVEEFNMSMPQTIVKTEQQLKDISLIGLIEEACRGNQFLQKNYGILILPVGSIKTYKFFTKDIISSNPEQRFHNHMFFSRTDRERIFSNSNPEFNIPSDRFQKNI